MTIMEKIYVQKVIEQLAKENNETPEAVRAAMQECIDQTWNNKTEGAAAARHEIFPAGKNAKRGGIYFSNCQPNFFEIK